MAQSLQMLVLALVILSASFTNSMNTDRQYRSRIDDILKKSADHQALDKNIQNCEACKLLVDMAREIVKEEKSDRDINRFAKMFCFEYISNYPIKICQGMIDMNTNVTEYVLKYSKLTSAETCTWISGDCHVDDTPAFRWNVPLPDTPKPPVTPVAPPPPGSPTFRVLHLSDIHWDPLYTPGTRADCKDPLCCRKYEEGTKGGVRAEKYGSTLSCDTPLLTFKSLLQHVSTTDKPDYIIVTGDLTPHNVWNQTRERHLYIITTLFDMIAHYFPTVPIFTALGNHEGIPVDKISTEYITGVESMNWLYSVLLKYWAKWAPGEKNRQTISTSGAYSALVRPGFRVISLNMNYCPSGNWWLMLNATDPNHHLAWFISELQQAEDNKEKVHILGHIPPNGCTQAWNWNYFKITLRYESTITGQFFGHTHTDNFAVAFDPESGYQRATGMWYTGPSVTPGGGRYPAYRLYTVDARIMNGTWQVLDHETHFLNITEANIIDKDIWRKEYSAKGFYGMESLQPKGWADLIERFKTRDYLFQAYYQFKERMESKDRCEGACKTAVLCGLRSARENDPNQCPSEYYKGVAPFTDLQNGAC